MKILIRFKHGLGDAVQLTSVLKHLRLYKLDWQVDVVSLYGMHSAMVGLCNNSYCEQAPDEAQYERVFDLPWWENYNGYGECPNTKVTNCLKEIFSIKPDLSLLSYEINPGEEDMARAASYLESIGATRQGNLRYNAIGLHYEGNTSPHNKNLSHEEAALICGWIIGKGFIPVLLDWDRGEQGRE